MSESLGGARVAVLETRMNREVARLVERYGGEPLCVPAVREKAVPCDAEVARLVDGLSARTFDYALFLTGVSAALLFESADRLGRRAELQEGLKQVTTICRGPKPVAALRGFGVPVSVSAREPFTTAEVIDVLASLELHQKRIALLHYGERNETLAATLSARDAEVDEVWLYRWELPEDTRPLRDLVAQIVAGTVDAVAITCQVQVRHLFEVAGDVERRRALSDALGKRVVVAAVGPTCTASLVSFGVRPHVVPEHPKVGPMIAALARHMGQKAR